MCWVHPLILTITLPCSHRAFTLSTDIPPDGHLYTSGMEGEEVLITLNSTTREMFGNLVFDGKDFLLQSKNSQHFWSIEEEEEYEMDSADDGDDDPNPALTVSPEDNTEYNYTVTVHFTKEAKAMQKAPELPLPALTRVCSGAVPELSRSCPRAVPVPR